MTDTQFAVFAVLCVFACAQLYALASRPSPKSTIKFVTFKGAEDIDIVVNPTTVTHVDSYGQSDCFIYFENGHRVLVAGTQRQTRLKLEATI